MDNDANQSLLNKGFPSGTAPIHKPRPGNEASANDITEPAMMVFEKGVNDIARDKLMITAA